ncbi:MAG: LysM peptidoglycan-binding domain-containing protein [Spirochaetaceae bacterium]|jgi:membrane-bound lytic murein transglycosylase D|nr:LysM peptidoglycan-binding domain-containing protein [Spirochaetaceae bacterium]
MTYMARGKTAGLFFALIAGLAVCSQGETPEPKYLGQEPLPLSATETFERPLRHQRTPVPERISRQREDRLRFPVIPSLNGIDHPLTERFIKQYSAPSGLLWLEGVMKNAEPYLAFIRNEVESRGIPPEILYLPVIESGYKISARSSSGATGLWQFMLNSVKPYMIINEHLDERLDFWKSTHGALSKLEGNYSYYNDWALALAAYNSGSGAIASLIKRTGIKDYWILAEKKQLKTESVYYVPKLIAAYCIISNPRKFGLDISWKPARVEWTRLPVARQSDLCLIATHAGIDKDELLKMNSELRNNITPPDGYMLKVKATDAEAVKSVLDNNGIRLIDSYVYTIRLYDTLSALARTYGVTVDQIMAQNPGINPFALQPGKTIRIPALNSASGQYDGTKENAAREASSAGVWIVKKGDTLWSIAQLHKISPEILARVNGMSLSDTLSIGRRLTIP